METINNTQINEAIIEEAAEVIAATPKISWKKFGIGAVAVGAICAVGYGAYRFFHKKKDEEQATEADFDNLEVAKRDFLDEETEEE